MLIDRDRLENFLCGLQLTAKDQCLEFDHGQQQSKGHDGKILVHQEDTVLRREVTQDEHGTIQVCKGRHFATDAVVQTLIGVSVDEAISHPNTRADRLVDFGNQLERLFNALALVHVSRCESLRSRFKVVSQDKEARIAYYGDHFTRLTPDDVFNRHIQATNDTALIPIVKANEIRRAKTEQCAAVQTFSGEIRAESVLFRKVLENFNLTRTFTNSELAGIDAPSEFNRAPEALISPREGGVDDVFAVAANGNEPSVRVVRQALRVQFTVTEFLHR